TSGAASVPLATVAWRQGGAVSRLAVTGARFAGRLAPIVSGTWRLDVATADGGALEGEAPQLALRVVPDSAPVVTVPVPGRDTTLPMSLRQPLVIDVRDDGRGAAAAAGRAARHAAVPGDRTGAGGGARAGGAGAAGAGAVQGRGGDRAGRAGRGDRRLGIPGAAARGAAAVAARGHARARAATPRAAGGARQARPGRHAAGAAAACR